MAGGILTVRERTDGKFLRKKTREVDFSAMRHADIHALIRRMRQAMRDANGIGLSANQIGLPWRMFVAEVPDQNGTLKFYAIVNPEIEAFSPETSGLEEGCLSVPGLYGEVGRSERVTLRAKDKNGKRIKIKAWGLLARVFQHEVDHLNGVLFIDKAKNLHEVPTSERLRKREEKMSN